jgi:HipA-like kinase
VLEDVTAISFVRRLGSGRTKPPLFDCERVNGERIEVIAKLSGSGCGVHGILREAVMALLAADLGLPVPEPVLVYLVDGFIEALPRDQPKLAQEMQQSLFPTFGSRRLPPGFSVWAADREINEQSVEAAAEIFAFDALTLNADRRLKNPNCLWNGRSFAIFDHELGLDSAQVGTLLLPAPWQPNGLGALTQGEGEHVLFGGLRHREPSLTRLQAAWHDIDAERLEAYRAAVPHVWLVQCTTALDDAITYLNSLRDHIDEAFDGVRSVLA